jgi:DNA replication regulator DPB11
LVHVSELYAQIPNVKLRPADAAAVAASKARLAHNAISTAWALDSDGDELEGDSGVLDPCPRPLKGLIVCATGLADKVRAYPGPGARRGLTEHRRACSRRP